jgi:serine/threonine-protein kinase
LALGPGTRLGAYEILTLIGSGGMGEVYRAKDTKLGREVALKILPASFTNDPERVARFRREAQVLASLNNSHIAQIHGLEESNGTQFLVLELVDGESLDKRIAGGPIPIDEAPGIAKQIAEALEAAHEKGIIHRDLKPANIALTTDGHVKVLDFGLAKAVETTASGSDLSMPPTITTPAMMTGVGVILGTAAYMSPEQAKGRPADKRSDIWAFGCVLYEMLTGRRAFDGEDVSDTLAAVLRGEPDWSALPADTSSAVHALLEGCLKKDRAHRIREVSTILFILAEPASPRATGRQGNSEASQRTMQSPRWRPIVTHGATMTVTAVVVGTAIWVGGRPPVPRVTRMTITPNGTAALALSGQVRDVAMTPDGSRVVYVGHNGTQIFVRPLDALQPTVLATGANLRGPFTSSDGQWIGFFENYTTLKKVAITGGPAVIVAQTPGSARGAVWTADDSIIFATNMTAAGLQRVPAVGGTPVTLAKPDVARGETAYQWPEALPGGRAVLFTIAAPGGAKASSIAVLNLDTGSHHVVVRGGSHAQYAASGHLVYGVAGTLQAVPFDLRRQQIHGTAVPVLSRVIGSGFGAFEFNLANDGTLVYVNNVGSIGGVDRTLVWVDRTGQEASLGVPARAYQSLALSSDGARVAVSDLDQEQDIWIWDTRRPPLTRLTFEPGQDANPIWTLDGRRIIFSSDREGGVRNLWWQAADNSGPTERLTTSPNLQIPTGITPDGREVLFNETAANVPTDIMRLVLAGDRRPVPLVQTKYAERNAVVSPDGRWVAYESDSSGRFEIYVRQYPNVAVGLSQVSTAGGTHPLWARSGKELFYLTLDGVLTRVPIDVTSTRWKNGASAKLFETRTIGLGVAGRVYDVSPDSQRFLLFRTAGTDQTGGPPDIILVQHFDEELKARAPAK